MRVINKRVFISDLPETATQEIIEAAFGEYGEVTSVEIKERKKVDEKHNSLFFAYVNLDINDRDLQKCFKDFANGKWLEQCVMLQVARESFLERLKREREENKISSNVTTSEHTNDKNITISNEIFNDINVTIKESNKVSKRKRKISLELNENIAEEEQIEDEKELPKPVSKIPNDNGFIDDVSHFNNSSDFDYKIKTNKHKFSNEALKIPSVGNKPIAKVELHKKEVVNTSEANLKRLESLKNFKKGYQNQKSVIQAALSNVDGRKQNKIIFDEEIISPKNRTTSDENLNDSKQRKLLFNEESDEDDNVNFEVKKQFEGEKGQKLLELQSKYKNDKRFTLDSRFLDTQEDVNMFENVEDSNDMSLEEEKRKELEILSEVLGKKITMKSHAATKTENKKSMLRFDPTQPEHSKYEIVSEGKKKEKNKMKKELETLKEKKQEEKELPNVSKELFYKVNENLKGSLQEEKGFSLLNMFGKVDEDDEPEQTDETSLKSSKKLKMEEANPFRYESSDDEDETGNIPTQDDMNNKSIEAFQADRSKASFWTESFFFKPDDYRLQEGFDFIEKMKFDEKTDFSKLRRDLKEIVKAKVRNNQSKKKPFKRKLGGSKKRKMIRMKKALKK